MTPNSATALLTGSIVRNGDKGISKAVGTATFYQNGMDQATADYAAAKVSTRFRLRIETARLICTLSGIGGVR